MSLVDPTGLDLLAVEAFTWTPTLETAGEICIREVESGGRSGFAFLDIENVDQFPVLTGINFGSRIYAVGRKSRLARVDTMEQVLRSYGVVVLGRNRFPKSGNRISCAELGIDCADSLKEYRFDGAAIGIGALASLVRHLGDSAPELSENLDVADRLLNSALRAYLLTRDLIARRRPAEILIYNGRFAVSKGIAEAARLSGVGVRYHELVSTYDRFFHSPYAVHSMRNTRRDLRKSWACAGEERERIAEQYFTPGRGGIRLFETQFLEHQRRDQTIARTGRWRVVYYVSSIEEYEAVEDGFENPLFESQHAAAEWLARWALGKPNVELFIRMHPRARGLSIREKSWWDSLAAPNVVVLTAESPVESYELATSADRVVAYHSSMGAEASYAGMVSILIGDADYRGLDCVYEPETTAELEGMLCDRDLKPKPRVNCLPFGYQRLMRGDTYRFYQPTSFEEGGFLGRRITPDGEEPTLRRLALRALWASRRLGQARLGRNIVENG
jgi:hypothetical protein